MGLRRKEIETNISTVIDTLVRREDIDKSRSVRRHKRSHVAQVMPSVRRRKAGVKVIGSTHYAPAGQNVDHR